MATEVVQRIQDLSGHQVVSEGRHFAQMHLVSEAGEDDRSE